MSPRHGYRTTVSVLAALLTAAVVIALPYKSLLGGTTRPDLAMAASLHKAYPVLPAVPVVHSVAQSDPQKARIAQFAARRSYNASVMREKALREARAKAREKARARALAAQPAVTPATTPPAAPAPQGDPQQIASGLLGSYGWSLAQFTCLLPLWDRESGWNPLAENAGSGAYGIPQALPGDKMASAGPDWQTDAATQIRWGLGYIKGSYGDPCGAWAHEEAYGWY